MDITIDQLLSGKNTKIKDKEFFATKAYVEPFLDRVSKVTDDFQVKVELPDQITMTEDADDITYNRVWLQAVLPDDYIVDNHKEVIGMVYGLDTRKPVVKFYRGGINMACTNLCVFNPPYLRVAELEPKTAIDYKPVDNLIEQASELKVWLNKLHTTTFSRDEQNINENLGMWIRNCLTASYDTGVGKVKLATSIAIGAYKLLFESAESPYYVSAERNTDMFNIYNAFTELITNDKDKDIINKTEKTLLLKDILQIN